MTTQHLAARACEHLVLARLRKSAIKEHIRTCAICREEKYTVNQGWQYGTVRSEFAYYVPRTLNRTVLTCRTRTITKKAYRTSVPYFLAKIEAYRTYVPYCHPCSGESRKFVGGMIKFMHKLYIITNLNGDDFCS